MDEASDVVAERQALAAVLSAPESDKAREAFLSVPPAAWSDWRHADVARALRMFFDRGWPVDGQSLIKTLGESTEPHQLEVLSRVVVDLSTDAPPLVSLPLYLDRIRSLAALRAAHDAATLFRQRLEGIARSRNEVDYAEALRDLRQAADDAENAFGTTSADPPMSLDEMLGLSTEHDWLVPGLLERTDRLVLTGHEGRGKSELVAQLATTIAAGLHPFTGDPLPDRDGGYRVLVVDAENSQGQLVRRYKRIAGLVDQLRERHRMPGVDWRKFRQRMVLRPEGVELTDPRELSRISKAVELACPDVLVIGPLYKLTDTDVTDAQGAKTLVSTLDRLRVRHRCAVISEAHAGYAATPGGGSRGVRPFGSSIFLRWPEFGYGLQASEGYEHDEHPTAVDLVAWRGAREERNWPTRLRRDTGVLPWYPDSPTYFDIEMNSKREAS
jgi:hypothetical protein